MINAVTAERRARQYGEYDSLLQAAKNRDAVIEALQQRVAALEQKAARENGRGEYQKIRSLAARYDISPSTVKQIIAWAGYAGFVIQRRTTGKMSVYRLADFDVAFLHYNKVEA